MFNHKLSANDTRSVLLVQWHEFHLTVAIEIEYHYLLPDLRNHGVLTFNTELKFFNIEPLVFKIRCHESLGYLEVSHVSSLLMVCYSFALG